MKKRPTTILMTGLFVFFIAIGANSCSPKNEDKGEPEDGTLGNYVFDYSNRKIGAVAWGLATAAILLDESKYLEAAEHQIQWLIGFNAADISMMAGV